jgi:hypothetical protein
VVARVRSSSMGPLRVAQPHGTFYHRDRVLIHASYFSRTSTCSDVNHRSEMLLFGSAPIENLRIRHIRFTTTGSGSGLMVVSRLSSSAIDQRPGTQNLSRKESHVG